MDKLEQLKQLNALEARQHELKASYESFRASNKTVFEQDDKMRAEIHDVVEQIAQMHADDDTLGSFAAAIAGHEREVVRAQAAKEKAAAETK